MEARFEFLTARRIVFGAGVLNQVAPMMKQHGRRAFVVTGRSARHGEALAAVLRGAGMGVVNFSVSGEPEIDTVRAGVALAKQERCEFCHWHWRRQRD